MPDQVAAGADATTRLKTSERPLQDYVAEVSEHTEVRSGVPLPLGTHESEGGANFALFSRHASRVRLELFDHPADARPARVILIHENEHNALYLMFSAGADAVDFRLPAVPPGTRWYRAVDTSREAPQDLFAAGDEPLWEDPQTYPLGPRSCTILVARQTSSPGMHTAPVEAT